MKQTITQQENKLLYADLTRAIQKIENERKSLINLDKTMSLLIAWLNKKGVEYSIQSLTNYFENLQEANLITGDNKLIPSLASYIEEEINV